MSKWNVEFVSNPRPDLGEDLISIRSTFIEPIYGSMYGVDVTVEDDPRAVAGAMKAIAAAMERMVKALSL